MLHFNLFACRRLACIDDVYLAQKIPGEIGKIPGGPVQRGGVVRFHVMAHQIGEDAGGESVQGVAPGLAKMFLQFLVQAEFLQAEFQPVPHAGSVARTPEQGVSMPAVHAHDAIQKADIPLFRMEQDVEAGRADDIAKEVGR